MINIIGGGPIGCYTASILAKEKDVTLYEEHKEIGTPIQCTGILSETIQQLMKLKKEFIANKISSVRIHSPNKKYTQINFKKANIILYRNKFDQYFRNKAIDKGVNIIYQHRYTDKGEIKNLETKKTKKLRTNILVGADGPQSKVSKLNGLGTRKYLQGVQALIKKKNDNIVDFYPYIGTYAWAVPETENIIRVGVASEKNTAQIFRDFSKKYKGKILAWQGGIIPLHEPKTKTSKKEIYLVGDAAAQIKNTTGGGLISGMRRAEELSNAILKKQNYEQLWRKRVGKELWAHNIARKTMNKFSDKDWNKLVKIANRNSIKEILGKESRDEPIKLITKTIIRNPDLLQFTKKLL